jgi:glycosyltransferase involved in cell wall biosynthesis
MACHEHTRRDEDRFAQGSVCGGCSAMIGVVIPAHNEEHTIGPCLDAVLTAASSPLLQNEPVRVVVVLDDCSDATSRLAEMFGIDRVVVSARNVGLARAAGAAHCLAAGARWLAFTDADTLVSPDWLHAQLQQRSDVVCGTVGVSDWGEYGAAMQRHYRASYTDADGHRHIHGANLGVSAEAYRRSGGFTPLATSEDVALIDSLQACGATIAWSASPRVLTSARKNFRAPKGFGATLMRIDRRITRQLGAANDE